MVNRNLIHSLDANEEGWEAELAQALAGQEIDSDRR